MTDSEFNLLTCEAEELVQHLLQNRFASDEMAMAEFLQSAVSSLPNADSIRNKLMVQQQGEKRAATEEGKTEEITDSSGSCSNASSNASIGDSILPDDKPSVSLTCLQPRAKMDVAFGTKGIQFTDKKGDSFSVCSVDHIIVFPKSEDCRAKKKQVANMVLLVWNKKEGTAAVSYKKKSLHQVCMQLPFESPYPAATETTASSSDVDSDEEEENKKKADDDATSEWLTLLATALSFPIANVAIARNPTAPVALKGGSNGSNNQNYRFVSHQDSSMSTTVSGMPFLPCYHGVNDGVLFPLQEGLLFCKPPLFLPRSTLRSIECTGSNRYVTLCVVLDDKEQIEFTNIHTQEQDVLHKYIHEALIPAMQRDVAAEDGENGDNGDDEIADDGDAEIVNDGEEEEDQSSNTKSRKRKAAAEAANVNKKRLQQQQDSGGDDDEEEDDEDYDLGEAQHEEDENESGSDDDDDDDEEEDFEEQATETESEDED